jgi:hypothetical protein
MTYRRLDANLIVQTAQTLEARIASRFPDAGLRKVATELTALADDTRRGAVALAPPIWPLRIAIAALVIAGGFLFLRIGSVISFNRLSEQATGSVESLEAFLNTAILAGLGLTALIRLEARIKRGRVGRALHGLRAIIHVIDMHQLTKDPAALATGYTPTDASPARNLTAADLLRYLDYCSEMLAITGKLAALYAQSVADDGVAAAVNDIETLGSNLSRKIWQKITLLDPLVRTASPPVRPPRAAPASRARAADTSQGTAGSR